MACHGGRAVVTAPGDGHFVGRQRERAQLDARLAAAHAGAGQLVLVAGEPGVGKTRLADEATGTARRLGFATAWGRATDEAGSPPYWPFRQVLRALRGGGRVPSDVDLLGPRRGERPADERFALFEAVSDTLAAAAAPDGLLVVLDDVQWADPASLLLLVHLARGLDGARLAVVATYRDTETAGQDAVRAALAAMAREPAVTRIRLSGLDEAEVATQLAGVTGWAVPPSVAAAVCHRARGNPFFVAELGRLLAEPGDGTLPDGVRDAVRARLGRLSPGCRPVVSAAAVLGSDVDASTLAAATGRPLPGVLAALDEATAAGILTDLRFTHDLIRESARLEVPTTHRHVLHARAAEHLGGRADADRRVAEIAHHWLESLPSGDSAAAVRWAEKAAAQASAQFAWEEADALYRRALEAASGPGFTPRERGELLLCRAEAQVRGYGVDGARESLLAAVAIGRELGDPMTLARAVLTMEGLSDFRWDDVGRALCEEALAGFPAQDSAVRARLLAKLVVFESWHALDKAEPLSREALAMAERVGDRKALVEALRARQMVRSGPDGVTDRLALGDRLVRAGADGDPDAVLWGRMWRFDAMAQLGDLDGAEAELIPIDAVADRMRSPLARWHATRARATIAMARGRFEAARSLGEQAEALVRRAGHTGALMPSIGFLTTLWLMTGDGERAPDENLLANVSSVAGGALRATTAFWRIAAGDHDGARRLYRTLPTLEALPPFVLLPGVAATAELAAELGDAERAAQAYRMLLPYADLFVCGGAGVVVVTGSARRPLGVAAAALGRLDEAVSHLRAALAADERAGTRPYAAMDRFELARVLARRRRPGDRDEAAALAAAATAAADRLGMAPLLRRARELAGSLSGRVPGPLTARERQIAELVAQGLTNRQIAAAEHISERTVETHVQHVLGKLGFATRTQIATWVAADLRTGSP
jgi:DNA-binding CsgD family transcriptional regulator/tetratricopeptide (TPR) repeat protein